MSAAGSYFFSAVWRAAIAFSAEALSRKKADGGMIGSQQMAYSDAQPLAGTVTANPAAAARAGETILAEGGNAMDAAVAAALDC